MVPALSGNATLSDGPASCPRLLISNPSMEDWSYGGCNSPVAPPGPALTPDGLLLTAVELCPPNTGPPQPPKTVSISLESAPPGGGPLTILSALLTVPPGSAVSGDLVCYMFLDEGGTQQVAYGCPPGQVRRHTC